MRCRAATTEQKRFHDDLCRIVGCIVCREHLGRFNDFVSVHHCDGRTKALAHDFVLPLCEVHHQYGAQGEIAYHQSPSAFEVRYGSQERLLRKCLDYLVALQCNVPEMALKLLGGKQFKLRELRYD